MIYACICVSVFDIVVLGHGYEQDNIWNVSYFKYLCIYSTTPHGTPSDVPRNPGLGNTAYD